MMMMMIMMIALNEIRNVIDKYLDVGLTKFKGNEWVVGRLPAGHARNICLSVPESSDIFQIKSAYKNLNLEE